MDGERIGVLVMSYGTPKDMDDIERYYTHIRRGRRPSDAELDDLRARYAAIGGTFPLRENTARQVAQLTRALDARTPGRYIVRQGLKHAEPFIEEAVDGFAQDGIRRFVGLVLAPHYSALSVGEYIARAREMSQKRGLESRFIEHYYDDPRLIAAFAERVQEGLRGFPHEERVKVLFSAHSLPARIREMGDPYEAQLMVTSERVAQAVGTVDWRFVWQSAGGTREPWLGPDILEVLPTLRAQGYTAVLVAPIGFVSEHLEILYDLDIEAKRAGAAFGLDVRRIRMLDTDPRFIDLLRERVERAAEATNA
ncbi:MAG: ferrochelatase [Hydrogenibacillus sp.]|nr:ferrochelatase [Hydrogenibacillus sp.]